MASDDTSTRTSPAPLPPEKPMGISRKKKSASQTEVLERAYAGKCQGSRMPSDTLFFCLKNFHSGCTATSLSRSGESIVLV